MDRILSCDIPRKYPSGSRKRNRKRRECTISRRARSFSAVLSRALGGCSLDSRDARSFRRVSRGPRETRSRHQFFPCCHSRAQISSDLFVVYLSTLSTYMFRRSDVETTAAIRPVEHNSVGILFFLLSFFFLSLISRSPRARSINVYDAARSPSLFNSLLESLYD